MRKIPLILAALLAVVGAVLSLIWADSRRPTAPRRPSSPSRPPSRPRRPPARPPRPSSSRPRSGGHPAKSHRAARRAALSVDDVDLGSPQEATPDSEASARCAALTSQGQRCSRPAREGSAYCWQHEN